ncbi:hypothetical protein ACFPT7_02020 [Acidicapsa dinghuensis]|uniref:Uncharacterized protein n=1 Tax=Acidicapsa dinghuensis TaxID=2218256 RepID=A0ABW1EB78_9BACT|nr:hypothetical protein [Acidicapsa dinghuensis]
MFSVMGESLERNPDPYNRSLWPARNGRIFRWVREVSEAKAKSMRQQLSSAFKAAKALDDLRMKEHALALSRSMQGLYYRDRNGCLHRNFPKVTKRGSR